MNMQQSAPQTRNRTIATGVIVGLALAAIYVLGAVIMLNTGTATAIARTSASDTADPFSLLNVIVAVIGLVFCFIAGMIAARNNGTVGSAAFAGLLAGLLVAVGEIVTNLVITLSILVPTITPQNADIYRGHVIIAAGMMFLIYIVLGVAFGAWGGSVRKKREYQQIAGDPIAPELDQFEQSEHQPKPFQQQPDITTVTLQQQSRFIP